MRANHVIMGTGVSIDVPGLTDKRLIENVFKRLQQIDKKFSTYSPNSEISRFRRGELRESELSSEVQAVMRGCIKMEKVTNGFFSPWFAGQFDPTGYVKGWAIKQASQILDEASIGTYCVAIGGDLNAKSNSAKTWKVGIQNPAKKDSIIGRIEAKNLAMATSGTYLRGQHIMNPKTRRPTRNFQSLTVTGPSIIKTDVFATAAFVMGDQGLSFIENCQGYEALAVDKRGKILMTPGMPELLGLIQLL